MRRGIGVVLSLFAVSCGRNGVRPLSGILAVDPPALDFGDVALGKQAAAGALLRNDGLTALTVSELTDANGDFTVSGLPVTIKPGGEAKVRVQYAPRAVGGSARRVGLLVEGPPSPQEHLDLRGHAVLGLATLSADALDFGPVVVGETARQTIYLGNNDGHASTEVRIECEQGSPYDCRPGGYATLSPEQSLPVEVAFTPGQLGTLNGTAQITPCPTCAPRQVSLTGTGVERLVDVEPTAIDFGDTLLGETPERGFTLVNHSRGPVRIDSSTLTGGPGLTIDAPAMPFTLGPGQSVQAKAHFAPRQLGAADGQVSFRASDGGPAILKITGLGMGAVLHARPSSLYVGAAAIGTTRDETITITNTGLDPHQTAPLRISAISKTGDPALTFDPPPSFVGEPGSSVTIKVHFTPTQPGLAQATLLVDSNDGLHPHITLQLAGSGRALTPCTLDVAPASPVDFGATPVFHSTTQGFELVNTTSDDCIVGSPQLVAGGPAFRWPGGVIPSGRTLPPGGRMSVRVEFEPEQPQTYAGAVEMYVSNPGAPSLRVDLRGRGDSGCFFLTPGALDFGGIQAGCSGPEQSAYAVNQCAQAITVSDVHVSGQPFSLGGLTVPFTVPPQGNARIPVEYQPSTPGDDVGTLTATSNGSTFQIGLTAGATPERSLIDQWDQSTPKVDMLFVIDNSGSMGEEQQALAHNLDKLWNRIALANADFHIAVTSSGMSPYTSGWTQCPGGAMGGEAGRFFPVDNSHPRLLTPQTPNVRDALFANTAVGLCHWEERFLDPAIAALTDPLINSAKAPGTQWPADGNLGFLRDDARLALFAVSDTDDDSDMNNPPPVADAVAKLVAVKHGARDLVSFAGIVPLTSCAASEGVGTRYGEIARQLDGHLEDICNLSNFGTMLENSMSTLLLPLTSFPLSSRPRDPQAIRVTVNGSVDTSWSYDAASNRIVFPRSNVPAPGSHIEASYQAACN